MYLVTGASGHFGQAALAHLLHSQGAHQPHHRRHPHARDKLASLKSKGVDVRAGDFDDEASLVKAFAGAKRLLLISTDDLTSPGKRQKQHEAAVRAAKAAGVEHIVYTSIQKADTSTVSFRARTSRHRDGHQGRGLQGLQPAPQQLVFREPVLRHSACAGLGHAVFSRRQRQGRPHRPRRSRPRGSGGTGVGQEREGDLHTDRCGRIHDRRTRSPDQQGHRQVARRGAGAARRPEAGHDRRRPAGGSGGRVRIVRRQHLQGRTRRCDGRLQDADRCCPQAFEDWLKANAKALAG